MIGKYKIFRFCESGEMGFSQNKIDDNCGFDVENIAENSYLAFFEKATSECQNNYTLLIREGVFLPYNINEKIQNCVNKANSEFGSDGWLLIGNSGVDYFNHTHISFMHDGNPDSILCQSDAPQPVSYLEDKIILVNLDNFKKIKKDIPQKLKRKQDNIFYILIEAYLNYFICAVDSNLAAVYAGDEEEKAFEKTEQFMEYWKSRFMNHLVTTTRRSFFIETSFGYLNPKKNIEKRIDFYGQLADVVYKNRLINATSKKINIIIRTQIENIDYLTRLLISIRIANLQKTEKIRIKVLIILNSVMGDEKLLRKIIMEECSDVDIVIYDSGLEKESHSDIGVIKLALDRIDYDDNSMVWIVNDDSFIFPDVMRVVSEFSDNKKIIIGDVVAFNHDISSSCEPLRIPLKSFIYKAVDYHESLYGRGDMPICSVIYPLDLIKRIFSEKIIIGEHKDDFALFLFSAVDANLTIISKAIAGVSLRDNMMKIKDKNKINHIQATFISEMISSRCISRNYYDYMNQKIKNNKQIYCNNANIIKNKHLNIKHMLYLIIRFKKKYIKKVFIK
ncbi:MAG: hypothetical protein WC823_01780 [Parcubacteria group bacterium]|jgi:hypothetical protein